MGVGFLFGQPCCRRCGGLGNLQALEVVFFIFLYTVPVPGTWYLNAANTAGTELRFLKIIFNFCLKLMKGSLPECERPLEEYYPEWLRIDRPASEHNFASPLLPEHRNLKNWESKRMRFSLVVRVSDCQCTSATVLGSIPASVDTV